MNADPGAGSAHACVARERAGNPTVPSFAHEGGRKPDGPQGRIVGFLGSGLVGQPVGQNQGQTSLAVIEGVELLDGAHPPQQASIVDVGGQGRRHGQAFHPGLRPLLPQPVEAGGAPQYGFRTPPARIRVGFPAWPRAAGIFP